MDLKELNKVLSNTPLSKKIIVLVLIIMIFSLIGYYYIYKPKVTKIMIIEPELRKLQKTLKENLAIAEGIKDIEEELKKIADRLAEAQAQLPTEKEIPNLLTKISNLGNMVGLEFLLFKPKKEVPREFYNEVPIDIRIKGNYHMVAQFYDMIAHLPRIVNISNFSMKSPKLIRGAVVLETSCVATTFRFTAKSKQGEKKKGRRK